MNTILSTNALTKYYGSIRAVNQLNLNIEKESVYGILGPNGSGKTTTLGMVLGIINATAGNFSWFERGNGYENRKRIGAILEQPIFYPYLSGEENLRIAARIKEIAFTDIDRVMDIVDLKQRRKSAAKTYSLGMKQRLAIASCLLGNPEVLVLDEPTNGLDPQGIAEIRTLIQNISTTGKTIILASHLLDEVEKVCTHVSVIKNGNLLAEGTVAQILTGDTQLEIAASDNEKIIAALTNYPGIKKIAREKDILLLAVDDSFSTAKLNRYLLENNIEISHLNIRKKRLEEQFLELTA